ncbi:MAG TPA: hypothetical protein VET26_02665, partial [Candidatus Sulfotelmatobacter sp.]|nr:hypothetical protein [Candidatus Sulfotelmatobacter sp.]
MALPPVALCWMPALLGVDQGGKRQLAGFVDVTSAATVPDPRGNVIDVMDVPVGPGGTSPQWALEAQPTLRGEPFATYARAAQRWLPARPEMVAPDGLHYAYKAPDGPIHLVDAATGADQAIANPNDLNAIGYTSAGVWLVQGAGSGLLLLDRLTGAIGQILAPDPKQSWQWLRGGAIWGFDSSGLPGSAPATTLLHFDLTTRVAMTWYAQSGGTVMLAAVDATGTAAVVTSQGSTTAAVAVPGPGAATALALPVGTSASSLALGARQETDTHGGWIIDSAGVYLFTGSG